MRAEQNSSLVEPPSTDPHELELARLRLKWSGAFQTAEDLLKRVERNANGVGTGVLNELRYSAEHVRRALVDSEDHDQRCSEWLKAIDHCRRAQFDAAEIVVISMMEEMQRFFDDFTEYAIALEAHEVTDAHEAFEEARQRLDEAYVLRDQRETRAEEMLAIADALKIRVKRLRALRPRYHAEVRKKVRSGRRFWIGIAATIAAAAIGGIAAAVASILYS